MERLHRTIQNTEQLGKEVTLCSLHDQYLFKIGTVSLGTYPDLFY
jgi:hypothetical protein